MSDYSSRAEAQIRQYEAQPEIHDLPAIFHLWSNSFLALRMRSVFGTSDTAEFYAGFILESFERTGILRVVSIGAGDASIEISVANALRARGAAGFRIHCLELSPVLVERAEQAVRQNGLTGEVFLQVCDINQWRPDAIYGAVMAHHSLHHIVELEHLFAAIDTALAAEGLFVTQDIIGRNGHMRWPESLAAIEHIWRQLPIRFKYNHALRRLEREFDNWDCSTEGFEGIRAQDILPLCVDRFKFRRFLGWGGLMEVFTDRGFGPNFDPADPFDREILRRTQLLEDRLIDTGSIKPSAMAAVMAKRASEPPIVFRQRTPEFCLRPPNAPAPSLPELDWQVPDRAIEPRARNFGLPRDCAVIEFDRPAATLLTRAIGWNAPEPEVGGCWTKRSSATLLLDLTEQPRGALSLRFDLSAYIPPSGEQQVDLVVNGISVAEWSFTGQTDAEWTKEVAVSEEMREGDELLLEFRIARPRIPGEDGKADIRPIGLFLRRVTIAPAMAGKPGRRSLGWSG
jgi:SAM-dependent methyltransferase